MDKPSTTTAQPPQQAHGPHPFLRAAAALCAFTAGAAVMVYEFLAVRILQRDFGGSIDVWAAEIAVCLAGLAIGYSIGGYLADRFHDIRLMGIALALGGALGFLIEPLALYMGRVLLNVNYALAWHPLIAALVCTFFPILLLGTVFPQAVRLYARDFEHVGAAAGRIAAISTIGSIAGTLVTVMTLLPRHGVLQILHATSWILIVLGGAAIILKRRRIAAAAILFLFLIPAASAQVRYETYSAYHHIIVRDEGNTRALLFDDAPQTLMSLTDPYGGGFEYADFFHVPMIIDPTIDRVLFIGLGGGTGPKSFFRNYPEMQIEAVEIDPQVVEVAREFFALPQDPRLRIQVSDGRAYLRRASGTYGAILMDAYGTGPYGPYLPYHMATREFFTIAWEKLDNGGSLFYNAIGEYGREPDEVIRHVQVTLESVFQAVYVFQARTSMNTVFIAVKIDPTRLRPDGTRDGQGWPNDPWLQHPLTGRQFQSLARQLGPEFLAGVPGIENRVTQFSRAQAAPRRGEILTDNYAPVDVAPGRRR